MGALHLAAQWSGLAWDREVASSLVLLIRHHTASMRQRFLCSPIATAIPPTTLPSTITSLTQISIGGGTTTRGTHPASLIATALSNGATYYVVLANRSILFVGDSMADMQVVSLLAQLHALSAATSRFPNVLRNHTRANKDVRVEVRTCGGRGRIGWVRNDLCCDPSWSDECTAHTASRFWTHVPFV